MKLRSITFESNESSQNTKDLFADFDISHRKIVEVQQPTAVPYKLKLYRGFDANLDDIHRHKNHFILSPEKSEQGLLWFTHKLISNYDALEYAKNKGNYLLTYPLDCVRHTQRKIYDDGSYRDEIPQKIQDATDPTSNSQFHMGIELPSGWIFSYKTEKFIGCSKELLITSGMLTPQ